MRAGRAMQTLSQYMTPLDKRVMYKVCTWKQLYHNVFEPPWSRKVTGLSIMGTPFVNVDDIPDTASIAHAVHTDAQSLEYSFRRLETNIVCAYEENGSRYVYGEHRAQCTLSSLSQPTGLVQVTLPVASIIMPTNLPPGTRVLICGYDESGQCVVSVPMRKRKDDATTWDCWADKLCVLAYSTIPNRNEVKQGGVRDAHVPAACDLAIPHTECLNNRVVLMNAGAVTGRIRVLPRSTAQHGARKCRGADSSSTCPLPLVCTVVYICECVKSPSSSLLYVTVD